MSKPKAFRRWPASMQPTYGPYRAIVDHWKDADTGCFCVDLGFDRYIYIDIRVHAYSSPEAGTVEGEAATVFANMIAPEGSRAMLRSNKNRLTPTLARFAAIVELQHGLIYGEALLAAGHAREGKWIGNTDHSI